MTDGEERERSARLMSWANDARVRSAAYAAQAVRAAESAAAIGERVDRMIERLAERNPEYAERLQAIIVTAADQRAAIAELKCSRVAARPGQLLPRARNAPEAAASTGPDGQRREMAITCDRDRTVGELHDQAVRAAFTAGLTLQDTAELTTEPEVRWRIEAAVDDLSELIRVIRGALFSPVNRSPSHDPDSGPDNANLTSR